MGGRALSARVDDPADWGGIVPVPSVQVMDEIEAAYARSGHDLGGSLSRSHGFVPSEEPPSALPPTHRAWDELAEALPELYRTVTVRRAVDALPDLSGADDALPAPYVHRAAAILGLVAASYLYSDHDDAGPLPEVFERPWTEVNARLGRPEPYLHYEDIIFHNWCLRDGAERTIDNLDLLVPTVGTEHERIFYVGQVELTERCAPIVAGIARTQDAAATGDWDEVERQLIAMTAAIRHVRERTFLHIDPNAASRYYVDPVLWGNTVASLAVSTKPHIPNPGGTASPLFHLIDAFLRRDNWESGLGKEAKRLRALGAPNVARYIDAVDEFDARSVIVDSGSRILGGLWNTFLDVYAGRHGLLEAHRLKAIGYVEIGFKVGRTTTLGGIAGLFRDRPWMQVDDELRIAMRDREPTRPLHAHEARVVSREATDASTADTVQEVVLDVGEQGLLYRPGDRLSVLPRNSDRLVERTLEALGADGDAPIPLTPGWAAHLAQFGGDPEAATTPLRTLLTYGRIRPVPRRVAKTLQRWTGSERIRAIIEARHEDQHELWELLEFAATDGYDVGRLTTSEAWQDEALARLVEPDVPRLYSICSIPDDGGPPSQLRLTVQHLTYTDRDELDRAGTASTFLTSRGEDGAPFPVRIIPATRFQLPEDPAVPVVMFAGGTGLSPFLGFLRHRAADPDAGPSWLLFGTRSEDRIYYRDELTELVRADHATIDIALSREPARARWMTGTQDPSLLPAEPARIDALLADADVEERLWRLLGPESPGDTHLYICGQAAFAHTVTTALSDLADRRSGGEPEAGRRLLRDLVAEGRLQFDVFTTFAPVVAPGPLGDGLYDASEVVLHNDDEHGRWFVLDGMVYDVTRFAELHPGGHHVIHLVSGMDAGEPFRRARHDEDTEVLAMTAMYKRGRIRRLDLRGPWGVALGPDGLEDVSLDELFRRWVRHLYLLVEMQNSHRNDLTYLDVPLTTACPDAGMSAYKLMLFGDTHRRFVDQYLHGAVGDQLDLVWTATIGLCAPEVASRWLHDEVSAAIDSPAGVRFAQTSEAVSTAYRGARGDVDDETYWQWADRMVAAAAAADARFLTDMKMLLRDGVQQFERHESRTVDAAGPELVTTLRRVPDLVTAYLEGFTRSVEPTSP